MKYKKIIYISLIILVIVGFIIYKGTLADDTDTAIKVEENSDLTYYLGVSYDGVDIYDSSLSYMGVVSSLESGYLLVEDRIPEGLEFVDFVATYDGTIGASNCYGNVVDDTQESTTLSGQWNNNHTEYTYHGLHYNTSNRTVSFKIENLQVGCKLNVGIKVRVPSLNGKTRIDFYNYGLVRDSAISVYSNLLHHYIGSDNETLIPVRYEYSGTVPDNAPSLPPTNSYAQGTKVGVSLPVFAAGYRFSGWTSNDVTITDNSFDMPNSEVVITGSFTPVSTHTVSYRISGVAPDNYETPESRDFYENMFIKIDSGLKPGDVYNGYRFLGWTTTDAEMVSDKNIIMPDHDVEFVGTFEEEKYKVTYVFTEPTIPSNYYNVDYVYYYKPGERVQLLDIEEPSEYKFLGWKHEDNFKMPKKDIKIYGSWKPRMLFRPNMEFELVSEPKEYYRVGDKIEYKLKITNEKPYDVDYDFETTLLLLNDESEFEYSQESDVIINEYGKNGYDENKISFSNVAPGETVEISLYNYISTYEFADHKSISSLSLVNAKKVGDNTSYTELDSNQQYSYSYEINVPAFPILELCLDTNYYYPDDIVAFDIMNDDDFQTTVLFNDYERDFCNNLSLYPGEYTIKLRSKKGYILDSINAAECYENCVVSDEEDEDEIQNIEDSYQEITINDNVPFNVTNQQIIKTYYLFSPVFTPFLQVVGFNKGSYQPEFSCDMCDTNPNLELCSTCYRPEPDPSI